MLALSGALLARVRLPLGAGRAAIIATALPAGIVAVGLVLASAWAGGVAIGRSHAGIPGAGLFTTGGALILLGVVAEELLLRGLLQPTLVRCWGPAAGVLVCSLAFTVIHMVGGWGHPLSLLNILLAGIWFGLLAWRSGGLVAPILAHFGYNWTEEMIFGASPNPGVGAFGSVVDVDLVGSAIWGGSNEGLNASLAVSLVLVALIIPLAMAMRARTSSGDGATVRP
ncbi:CPBP family intramembrane metalloprotease [Sphingomonas solaris]|uniref:CPBP family intramembrane metalloprotease n=2 Tax=Alterirhizorhabdus solaris TaxID=2529389 RepID=A0A558QZE5_9SPHN|nr:CPBP family intramembrane metalloprotease [Sphingomonas solaris]